MPDRVSFSRLAAVTISANVREVAAGARSMEEAAGRIIRYLYDHILDERGNRYCTLVRLFKTHRYDHLEPELARVARSAGGPEPAPETRCLVLLATAGQEPAWNSRHTSAGHRAIPLTTQEVVAQSPMIARLIQQFGLDVQALVNAESQLLMDPAPRTYNLFHVAEASGSPYVPAQETFVKPYGVRSVVGFGGPLPRDLFAVILFSRVAIDAETASLFRSIALSITLALLPYAAYPTFHSEVEPDPAAVRPER
jgi:hypothetical protein